MEISFNELKERDDLKYVVIISEDESGNVYVKHKDRDTWEIPGGHIESGETPLYAAKRELIEETGAKDFTLEEICDYSVERGDKKSFGRLFYSFIGSYKKHLQHEIEIVKSFTGIPENQTYSEIQPLLLEEVLKRRQEDNKRLNTIRQLEIELLSHKVRKDPIRLNELIADNFIEFGASGNRYDKKTVLESVPLQDEFHYSIHDFAENRFGPGTVHVTYRLEKDSISSLRSSIWQLNNEQWQMIFHQGTNQKRGEEI